jgi:CHAD domain-containing protein
MEPDQVKLKEIKPALTGYIKESLALLHQSAVPDENTVHDVRVLMKKARSVVSLIAPQMDTVFIVRERQSLREVGRIMCSWRDISVLRKALKNLRKRNPDIFLKLADNEKINLLVKKPESVEELPFEEKNNLEQIVEILNKSGYRIRFEPMNKLDPNLLLKSLEAAYLCVVNNYMICRNNPKPASLHEFRKRAKDLLYQLWFFRPLNPTVVKALEKKLDMLTQNLGKYNDLSQLLKEISYRYEYTANHPALDELAIIIREEQDKNLAKVWPTAHKLFCPGQNLVNLLGFKLLVI